MTLLLSDPLDMTHVRLYSQDAKGGLRYVTDAHPHACFARNIQEQQQGDMDFIRTMDMMVKEERIRRQMEAAELETNYGVAPEQHGLNRPRIKGISPKTVERVMAELSRQVAPAPDPLPSLPDAKIHRRSSRYSAQAESSPPCPRIPPATRFGAANVTRFQAVDYADRGCGGFWRRYAR